MNMFKKNGGFTLVELIVVIAILAILAGVAVPAYSGYIKKANDTAVVNQLAAVHTAVTAANATSTVAIKEIIIDGSGNITVTWNGTAPTGDALKAFYKNCADLLANGATSDGTNVSWSALGTALAKTTAYKGGAKWTSDGWTGVAG